MINVSVLIYEKDESQLKVFMQSLLDHNNNKEVKYTFTVLNVSKIPEYENCNNELLQPYNDNYRFAFLNRVDQELKRTDIDLVLIADDRCFVRKSVDDICVGLMNTPYRHWELCGSVRDPDFDVTLIDNAAFIPIVAVFGYLDFGFVFLNPKTLKHNNTQLAEEILPEDVLLHPDRAFFNIEYDAKIMFTDLLIDEESYNLDFDHRVVLFDVDNLAYAGKQVNLASQVYLKEYLNYVKTPLLRNKVKNMLYHASGFSFWYNETKERLMTLQSSVLSKTGITLV